MPHCLRTVFTYLPMTRVKNLCEARDVVAESPWQAAAALEAQGVTPRAILGDLTDVELNFVHRVVCNHDGIRAREALIDSILVATNGMPDRLKPPGAMLDGLKPPEA